MAISYNKLWRLLKYKSMNKSDLKKEAGLNSNILAKMGKNEFISMESLYKVCVALKCDIGDVVEVIDDALKE